MREWLREFMIVFGSISVIVLGASVYFLAGVVLMHLAQNSMLAPLAMVPWAAALPAAVAASLR